MKTTRLFVSLFLVATFWLIACNAPSDRKVIDLAFQLAEEYPDSAARLLENKIVPASLTDSNKADYWYLTAYVHIRQGRSMVNDSLIAYSVDYYGKHNYTANRLFNACKFASWQTTDKKKKEDYLLEMVAVAEKANQQSWLSEAYNLLSSFYYEERKYEQLIDACHKWIRIAPKSKPDAWYTLGLNYSRMGREDSSLYYLSRASALAYETKHHKARHYMRNYIDVLAKSDPHKALKEYRFMQQIYPEERFTSTALRIWMALGQKDSVDYHLSLMENGEMNDPSPWYITRIVMTKALRAHWDAQNGKIFNMSSLAQFVDSTSLVTFNLIKDEKERALMQNKLLQDNQRVESKRQQILIVLFALLFVFTAIGSVAFFYIRNRREKLLAAEEKLETLQQLLREATVNKEPSGDLPITYDSLFFRKVLLQQLGIIRLVATSPTQQNKELLHQMAHIANNETPTDSLLVWEDLYPIIDTVYDHFYTRLLKLANGCLSEKELQLCCLLRAGFSTKEISVVIQQSIRTIYQRKTSIRHALGVNEKDDIIDYINRQEPYINFL